MIGLLSAVVLCMMSWLPQAVMAQSSTEYDSGWTKNLGVTSDGNYIDSTSTSAKITYPSHGATQGWPAQYRGVMLQGFYWMSYDSTKWTNITAQADTLGKYFDAV